MPFLFPKNSNIYLDPINGVIGISTSSTTSNLHVVGKTTLMGKVGISTSPVYDLDINGSLNVSGSIYKAGTLLTGTTQWNTTNSNIYFNSGYVGIGTNNPLYTLHTSGNIYTDSNIIINTGSYLYGNIYSFSKNIFYDGFNVLGNISYPFYSSGLSRDNSIVFNNTGTYLTFTQFPYDYNTPLTIELEIYLMSYPTTNVYILTTDNKYLNISSTGLIYLSESDTSSTYSLTTNLSIQTWYKLMITYQNNNYYIYLSNTLNTSFTTTPITINTLTFGGSASSTYLKFYLRNVRISSYIRSTSSSFIFDNYCLLFGELTSSSTFISKYPVIKCHSSNIIIPTLNSDTITINKKVGIGTTNPNSNLHIIGTTQINTPGLTIDLLGNVGIGTTQPSSNLHVLGTTQLNSNGLTINQYGNVGIKTTLPTMDLYVDGVVQLNSSGLTVDTLGNVGIGTTNPTYDLHVMGTSQINSQGITVDSIGNVGIGTTQPTSNLHVRGTAQILNFNSQGITVDSLGEVGIGTTQPTSNLHVVGNINVIGDIMTSTTTRIDSTGILQNIINIIGVVVPFAGSTAPSGWLLCYGQLVNRTTYSALYGIIGTTYSSGDGSTTFGIPDLRGRTVAGKDNMGGTAASRLTSAVSGLTATTLGNVGGDQRFFTHSHSVSDPGHTHYLQLYGSSGSTNASYPSNWDTASLSSNVSTSIRTQKTGLTVVDNTEGGLCENVQPTIILNYIIKY